MYKQNHLTPSWKNVRTSVSIDAARTPLIGTPSYLDGCGRRGERVTLQGRCMAFPAPSTSFDVLREERRVFKVLPNLWKHGKRRVYDDAWARTNIVSTKACVVPLWHLPTKCTCYIFKFAGRACDGCCFTSCRFTYSSSRRCSAIMWPACYKDGCASRVTQVAIRSSGHAVQANNSRRHLTRAAEPATMGHDAEVPPCDTERHGRKARIEEQGQGELCVFGYALLWTTHTRVI